MPNRFRRAGFDREQLARAGRRVEHWRRDHDRMTQVEFAKLAGVGVGAVQNFEAGTRTTRRESLDRIAGVLGLSGDELVSTAEPVGGAYGARIARLLPDSIDVADAYQNAEGEIKIQIKTLLREYYEAVASRRTRAHAELNELMPTRSARGGK